MTARKNLSNLNLEKDKRENFLKRSFATLGPGLITGAADDDPSGISTYSVAGAAYGYGTLWIALLTFPLMAAVQLMCARLGMVTGRGLAAAVRVYYPRWVLWGACSILVVANIINIGADLGGMAEATQLITGIRPLIWIPFYALVIIVLLFWTSYKLIARIFKWLTLVLFSSVLASFYAHVEWRHALAMTFLPHVEWSRSFLAVLVAILGTTISPYLFFWQAAEEVEEDRAKGQFTAIPRTDDPRCGPAPSRRTRFLRHPLVRNESICISCSGEDCPDLLGRPTPAKSQLPAHSICLTRSSPTLYSYMAI